jgi:hypothetical protein
MSEQQPGQVGPSPTDEELAAAYEAQLKQIRVEDVLIQTLVSLLNLGGRKAGLSPGTEDERDPEQVRQAIEGVRALLPIVEPLLGKDAAQIREALSQLQLAYTRIAGDAGPETRAPAADDQSGAPAAEGGGSADEPGPAQSSGRLWVPGQ